MKIQVKCDCGKMLYVPVQYAGKRGRCPQCARMLSVPELTESLKNPPAPTKVCPTCGAYLSTDDDICVTCRMNLKTGHWNMAETSGLDWKKKGQLIIGCIIIFGLPISIYMLWQYFFPTRVDFSEWNTGFTEIEQLSEDTSENVQKKMQAIQELWKKLPSNIARSFQILQELEEKNKKLNWDTSFEIEIQKERNLFTRCLRWQNIQNTYKHPTIDKNLQDSQQNLIQFLRERQGEIHQLSQEKRILEIVTRITPRILLMMEESCQNIFVNPEVSLAWKNLKNIYQNVTEEAETRPSNPISNQENLKKCKEKFYSVAKEYEKFMKSREYQQAQQLLENFWQELHSLEEITSENEIVVEVRNRLKEVQSIKALFSIANEGARSNIGLNKALFSKDGKAGIGRITQYALEIFYIQAGDGKIIKIALKDLQPEEIVFFALNSQKNKHVYEYAGIFYLYEQNLALAQQSFISALRLGANSQDIQRYLEQIHEQIAKEK